MEIYYIVRTRVIDETLYVMLPPHDDNPLEPKFTPFVGNAYLFKTHSSAEAYADSIKSCGYNAEICKLKFVGSYEV